MAVLGSVVVTATEAQKRINAVKATWYGNDGAKRVYSHSRDTRFVIWEDQPGGKVKLTESTTCGCRRGQR